MLCDLRGRFLYEARPDVFPEGRMTTRERALWGLHYEHREQQRKSKK